jgi:hypothetical protein
LEHHGGEATTMPGLKFTCDLDAEALYKIAFRRAQDLGFTVRAADDRAFVATSGSLPLSFVVGAFVAYCDFRVDVEEYEDGNELVLERNTPWWAGMIGVSRVKAKANQLVQNIKDEVELRGGKVTREKTF